MASENVAAKEAGALRKTGIAIACIIGGVSFGLVAVTIPFVLPALRKYCLPYVPATTIQMEKVLHHVKGRPGKVVDLGSGDGRVCIAAAKQGNYAVGYELNPWLVWYSRWKALTSGVRRNTEFHTKDLWKIDLEGYNTIVIFGVESMMEPLWTKINKEVVAKQRSDGQTIRLIACLKNKVNPRLTIGAYPHGTENRSDMSKESFSPDGSFEEDTDKVSPEVLSALGSSEEIKRMLSNKHLRDLLQEIDQSDRPQRLLKRAMNIPVFAEFANECLRVCGMRE